MPRGATQSALHLLSRIGVYIILFVAVWILAGVLFWYAEYPTQTLGNSFYWAIVTLGTVGYGDVVPTTIFAKELTSGVIVMQIFLLGYLIAVITSTVTEEAQRRALGLYGTPMRDHVIVLGFSGVGQSAVRELLVQDQKVAYVVEEPDEVPNARALANEDRLFVTYGRPSDRSILDRVNLSGAHSVIVCTEDDAANMIAALNIRAANPKLRIVVSVGRPELRNTLRSAGVTYVTSPSDMGGRLCASAAFEPEVALAIEDLTAADVQSDIREYLLPAGSPLAGTSFAEADAEIRRGCGCLLIGVGRREPNGEYRTIVNPPFDLRLSVGDAVILVCTLENARRSEAWFGRPQGR